MADYSNMGDYKPHIQRIISKLTGELIVIFNYAGTIINKSNFKIAIENTQCNEICAIKDVFGNYAIKCQSAILRNLAEGEKANIFLSDNLSKSESNKIEYTRLYKKRRRTSGASDDDDNVGAVKRRRLETNELTLCGAMRQASIIITNKHSKEDTKWRKLARLVNDYSFQNNGLQTCFHDALASRDPLVVAIITVLLQPEYNYYLSTLKSRRGQNLLHYACELKKLEYIKALLNRHTLLCEQDVVGNTPLHVAIYAKDDTCIHAICGIFFDYQETSTSPYNVPASTNLRSLFERMMSAHNRANYTPLHAAILTGNVELVMLLLNFCQRIGFDVASLRVLGTNKTAFDLVLATKSKLMYESFIKCCPNVENDDNYRRSLYT